MAQQNLRERLIGAWKLESYVEKPVDGSTPFYPMQRRGIQGRGAWLHRLLRPFPHRRGQADADAFDVCVTVPELAGADSAPRGEDRGGHASPELGYADHVGRKENHVVSLVASGRAQRLATSR